jgi:hypothetical protein
MRGTIRLVARLGGKHECVHAGSAADRPASVIWGGVVGEDVAPTLWVAWIMLNDPDAVGCTPTHPALPD